MSSPPLEQSVNRKWGHAAKPRDWPPMTYSVSKVRPPKGSTAFVNSTTSWGSSVQTQVYGGHFAFKLSHLKMCDPLPDPPLHTLLEIYQGQH